MKRENINLVKQLDRCPADGFPGSDDYKARFHGIHEFLNSNIHPIVTTASSLSDGGLLTDHGPEHVLKVIQRASDLVGMSKNAFLTPYELYVLLVAIHIHDVGNFSGRKCHELAAEAVMKQMGALLGVDTVEKRLIFEIAQAHGGRNKGDKDKIGKLPEVSYVLSESVRSRLLAALLRFADETADDRTRTSRFLIDGKKIPHANEIFHKYAYALQSVNISQQAVRLSFDLKATDVTQKFGKGSDDVYLLDEIYLRTIKMHRERMYCMRFLRPEIRVDRIDVAIQVFGDDFKKEITSISYRLEESGYPDERESDIFVLCPELTKRHACGSRPDGKSISKFVRKKLSK